MIQKEIKIINKLGLHARAAMKLTHLAQRYGSEITVTYNTRTVNAKSIMGLMVLGAGYGTTIILAVSGDDEQSAADAIEQLIADRFGEPE